MVVSKCMFPSKVEEMLRADNVGRVELSWLAGFIVAVRVVRFASGVEIIVKCSRKHAISPRKAVGNL